jgi:hypothetical protein
LLEIKREVTSDKLIPRSTLWVLLGAFLMVMAPHYANISVWISGLSLGVVVWRFLVFKGLVIYPDSKLKTLLVITSVAGFTWLIGTSSLLRLPLRFLFWRSLLS